MPLKTIKKPISLLIRKSATPAKNDSVFTPVRQTSILLMKRERWWSNLLVVWNAVPARSPVSMAPSNGNTPGVDLVYNIDLDSSLLT